MIEEVLFDNEILAIILRSNFHANGIKFFTPDSFNQQLGYMNRPAGYEIKPHVHNKVARDVFFTQEVIFIKSGKVKFDLYKPSKEFYKTFLLLPGDFVLLASGGHGFTMLEDSEIVEIKTGPHIGEHDKTKF